MAKSRTNYKELVGQVVNGVLVVDSERVTKTSKKTQKEYKVRRLWVTADGTNMLEIGTQSWSKFSFLKRLDKITTEWIYRKEESKFEVATVDTDIEKKLSDEAKRQLEEELLWQEMKKAIDEAYEQEVYSFHSKEEWAILEEASKKLAQELTQKKRDKIEDWRLPFIIKRMLDNIEFGKEILEEKVKAFTDINSEIYNEVYSFNGSFKFSDVDEVLDYVDDTFKYYEKWRWDNSFDAESIIYIRNEYRTQYKEEIALWVEEHIDEILERQRLAQEKFDIETDYKFVFMRGGINFEDGGFGEEFADAFREALLEAFGIELNEYDEKFAECNTVKDVKRVYRELAKRTHSDVVGGSDEEFIKVKEAYDRAIERLVA